MIYYYINLIFSFLIFGSYTAVNDYTNYKKIKAKDKIENIALQPGRYRLIYRPKFNRSIHTSVDKEIEITSGGSVSLKL